MAQVGAAAITCVHPHLCLPVVESKVPKDSRFSGSPFSQSDRASITISHDVAAVGFLVKATAVTKYVRFLVGHRCTGFTRGSMGGLVPVFFMSSSVVPAAVATCCCRLLEFALDNDSSLVQYSSPPLYLIFSRFGPGPRRGALPIVPLIRGSIVGSVCIYSSAFHFSS